MELKIIKLYLFFNKSIYTIVVKGLFHRIITILSFRVHSFFSGAMLETSLLSATLQTRLHFHRVKNFQITIFKDYFISEGCSRVALDFYMLEHSIDLPSHIHTLSGLALML